MARSDFDITLKKEAKTSLQLFKNRSLLRRRFGDPAVKLYNAIDSKKTAAQLISSLGISENRFVEILEFMNNNAMVSIVQASSSGPSDIKPKAPQPPQIPGKVAQKEKEPEMPAQQQEKDETDTALLSPLEKVLYKKYGQVGVKIYGLIDGEKTAEEILRQTGVSEAKLVEILEFMDEKGIIKLEKPEEKKPIAAEREKGKKTKKKPAREPRFKPIIEKGPEHKPFVPPKHTKKQKKEEPAKPGEKAPSQRIIMVDVPMMVKLSLGQKAVLYIDLSSKFGKGAKGLIKLIDGKKDFIDLALATGMSLFDIDTIMAYFGKKGFLTFRQLVRDEIKKKYGEDGFAIYKKCGRDGLLLYEMIGKEASLKDIIVKSKLPPEKAVDIFVFIHKVLGLDIPLDRSVIYRQLGLRK